MTEDICQRLAAIIEQRVRNHPEQKDRVLSLAQQLDPADRSPRAQLLREAAAAIRDHRG